MHLYMNDTRLRSVNFQLYIGGGDSLAPPLNQIALRHVDSNAALDDERRLILLLATQKTGLSHAAAFIDILNKGVVQVQSEADLLALIPSLRSKKSGKVN